MLSSANIQHGNDKSRVISKGQQVDEGYFIFWQGVAVGHVYDGAVTWLPEAAPEIIATLTAPEAVF